MATNAPISAAVIFFLTSNISSFAATEEVYLSDLRIIYAEDYSAAKEILSGTDFKDYKLLNENPTTTLAHFSWQI